MAMTTEQTFTFNRMAELPEGPWTGEPDKVVWVDEATDLDCMVLRNRMGAWCGYIGVPPGHPWFEQGYDDVRVPGDGEDDWPIVHGGLTFADFCHEGRGDDAICHTPLPGRPGHIWWLGFDCGHAGDLVPLAEWSLATKTDFYNEPRHFKENPFGGREIPVDQPWGLGTQDSYKSLAYAKANVLMLAAQAKEAAKT